MKLYKKQTVEGLVSYFLPYEETKRLYEKRFHSGVWKKTGEEFDVWLNVFAISTFVRKAVQVFPSEDLKDHQDVERVAIKFVPL